MALSKRGLSYRFFTDKLHETLAILDLKRNQYEKIVNEEGIINIGTSQNKLMFDLLSEKLNDPSNRQVREEHTQYADEKGYKSFREAVAKFLNHKMKPAKPISCKNIIALNGAGSVVEALGMALADPGEGFLIPMPCYGGFTKDLGIRADVKIVPADIPSQQSDDSPHHQYKLTVDILEKAYNNATKEGIKIRALVLVNPNNPFGYIYSEEDLDSFLQFAHRQGIHIILDELYLLSIFKEGCTMKCVLSCENIPDPKRLHVIWGLSKDFCVSGFRCGILHTTNQDLFDSIKNIAEFHQVSPLVQHIFTIILNDLDWIDNSYTPTNHKRLRENYKMVVETLQKYRIPFVEACAGFFVWADLRQFLSKPTKDEEWRLFNTFIDSKIYIVPGIAFDSQEPGWFRIVFSIESHILSIAMERFTKAVDICRKEQIYNNPNIEKKS